MKKHKICFNILIIFWTVLLFSCAGKEVQGVSPETKKEHRETENHKLHAAKQKPPAPEISVPEFIQKPISETEFANAKWPYNLDAIKKSLADMIDDWGEAAFSVDDELVRHVLYFYKYYSIRSIKKSNDTIERGKKYLPYIIQVFEQYRIPEEIAFALPFVESSFYENAKSDVSAVGMFQFMEDTARGYGLKINRSVDERKDYKKAAIACAKYLRNNRNVFASTVLSLGSYHHGTGKVSQVLLAVADAEERRFGPIFSSENLGKYSKEYIPQCLAAALMYRYMKERRLPRIPSIESESESIEGTRYVQEMQKNRSDLFALNPDLITANQTYPYANTGNAYVLLKQLSIGKIEEGPAAPPIPVTIAKKETKKETKIEEEQLPLPPPSVTSTPQKKHPKSLPEKSDEEPDEKPVVHSTLPKPVKKPSHTPKPTAYKWPDNLAARSSGASLVTGKSKYIRYVFQEGNSLEVIASIFGTTIEKLKQSPENRYLKTRDPQPGDVIRIDGLSPTTQKIGSEGYLCGKKFEFKTLKGETLKKVCQRAIKLIKNSCPENEWEMGTDISPELLWYWNREMLDNATPTSSLKQGLSLTVYSDYLLHKTSKAAKTETVHTSEKIDKPKQTDIIPKTEKPSPVSQNAPKVSSDQTKQQTHKAGTKYISYLVQNENIRQGNLVNIIARIFSVTPDELTGWNVWLKEAGGDFKTWIGKYPKMIIKNRPNSIQKFGNPGVVCGKQGDTRLTIEAKESLAKAVQKAKKQVQSCGGKGDGITEENLLYWNADILKEAGVNKKEDVTSKQVKLTVYSDYN